MTLLVTSLAGLAASRSEAGRKPSHLTNVNPAALTAGEKPGFSVHEYILHCCKWIYLAAERWHGHEDAVRDGCEAKKYVKSTTKANATAIIALIASVWEAERAIVLSAGCEQFLRKPLVE